MRCVTSHIIAMPRQTRLVCRIGRLLMIDIVLGRKPPQSGMRFVPSCDAVVCFAVFHKFVTVVHDLS